MAKKKSVVEEHYYICDACAIKKGWKWPEGHRATVHTDVCPYCNEKGMLSAYNDWLQPGEKELKNWD